MVEVYYGLRSSDADMGFPAGDLLFPVSDIFRYKYFFCHHDCVRGEKKSEPCSCMDSGFVIAAVPWIFFIPSLWSELPQRKAVFPQE
jgi:hypothetical protein